MSRAVLDSSADAPPVAAGGFADLQPLDQELASQLPAWDLAPPHSFLVRKPRKPQPVVAPQPPVEAARPEPPAAEPEPVAETPAVEIETDPAPLTAEAPASETIAEVEVEMPDTDIEAAPSPAVHADNCSECGVPLEHGSVFCPECGHKQ